VAGKGGHLWLRGEGDNKHRLREEVGSIGNRTMLLGPSRQDREELYQKKIDREDDIKVLGQ